MQHKRGSMQVQAGLRVLSGSKSGINTTPCISCPRTLKRLHHAGRKLVGYITVSSRASEGEAVPITASVL